MDRARAATTLLLWQIRGERELVAAANQGGERSLLSLVAETNQGRGPVSPPRPIPSPPLDPLVRLEEEQRVEQLRERLRGLSRVLRPDEYRDLKARLEPNLLPMQTIHVLTREMERFAVRERRQSIQRSFEAEIRPPKNELLAVMLFSRDGRLLAATGQAKGFDSRTLGSLAARAEPGSTWSLAHRAGHLVGHHGPRVTLVALFASRPPKNVPIALRASMASLEQREEGLINRAQHPTNQAALHEYLRAVRMLLVIEGS